MADGTLQVDHGLSPIPTLEPVGIVDLAARRARQKRRGGFRVKVSARTNGERLSFGFAITAGETHGVTACYALMQTERVRPKQLPGDKDYDSDAIREDSWLHGTDPGIPTKLTRQVQRPVDPVL